MADQQPLPAAATEGLAPKVVKISEELSCKLNEVEWDNRARELAESHREVQRQVERKKTVTAGLSNDVKIAQARESKLADIVASGEEQREVTVEVRYDYEQGVVTKTRTDTKEVITEREMTDQERQAELDLVSANDFIEGRHDDDGKPGDPFEDDDPASDAGEPEDRPDSDGGAEDSEPDQDGESPAEPVTEPAADDDGEPDPAASAEDDDDDFFGDDNEEGGDRDG